MHKIHVVRNESVVLVPKSNLHSKPTVMLVRSIEYEYRNARTRARTHTNTHTHTCAQLNYTALVHKKGYQGALKKLFLSVYLIHTLEKKR